MKVPAPLAFEWDSANRDKNWEKHKVHYKEAEEIFGNKPIVFLKDIKHSQTEPRYIALGITNQKRNLFVSYTVRDNKIRIISARDQSRRERKIYAKEKN
jgi:hypothetical protein